MITRIIDCIIERRLLVSYRIDPERVDALLPPPFRPQLVNGHAVGGVCFIRMRALRPAPLPRAAGVTTENVAHRFAVEWDDKQGSHSGVFMPRRDTSSRITAALGASIFPGAYHLARFDVAESADLIRIGVLSRDGAVSLSVAAEPAAALNSGLFASMDEATGFFRRGALGFSPSVADGCIDGVRLDSTNWAARPMTISAMSSSLFVRWDCSATRTTLPLGVWSPDGPQGPGRERQLVTSLILTSNRAPQDWYPLFPNPVVAESLLDRLINNSLQLFVNGPSYRPRNGPETAEQHDSQGGQPVEQVQTRPWSIT